MKKLSRIVLVFTLIAAMLAISINATTVVVPTDTADGWSGGASYTETEGGPVLGYAANGSTSSGTPILIQRKFAEPIDLSAYEDDGYLHIMMYVFNPDALSNNGQIELTSSGSCDTDETHWNVPFGAVTEGWNELVLDFEDATENNADYSAINFMRIYWFPADGADFTAGAPFYAITDVYTAKYGDNFTYPNSDIKWDALTYADMTKFSNTKTALDGKTAVEYKDSALLITEAVLDTPLDLSKYADGGYIHFWLYIEDVANFTDTEGQFELTSGGACDVDELTFSVTADGLKDGWNEITWCFDDAAANAADMSAINYMRLYKHVSAETTMMIRDISFGTQEEMDMVPETEAPVTDAPATDAPATDAPAADTNTADGETSADIAAPADDTTSSSSNTTTYIIIIVVAVVVIAIVVIAVVLSKKKKK